jgi:hypothetical protein
MHFGNDCESVGSHSVKAFSSSVAFLIMSHASHKRLTLNVISGETGKNQLEAGQVSVGDASVLSHCFLLRNPWLKRTGVLEHCREGETNCWYFIYPSDRIPKATTDVVYITLCTVAIVPVNSGNLLKLLHVIFIFIY